jgi:PAS domain S-box-containing protein
MVVVNDVKISSEMVKVIDELPISITLLDKELRILFINKTLENALGLPREDAIGKYCYEIFRDEICYDCGVEKALEDGKIHVSDRKIKSSLVSKNFAIPLKKDGKIVGVIDLGVDVREYRHLSDGFEEKYRDIFENSLDAIIITDLKGNILEVNKGFEELSGYSRGEVVGKSYREFVPQEYAEVIFESYNEAFREGKSVKGVEIEFHTKRGEKKIIGGNIGLIRKNGRVLAFLGNFRDVTEKKRIERTLYELNDTLRLINKIMRHDMLNDLTAIEAALELYRETGDESILAIIHEAVERSVDLINRMRKLEESTKMLEPMEVDVREIARKAADGYAKIVEINIEGDGKALADESLVSVFDNLIRNAIVHGKTDRIDISIDQKDFCEIRIADYGKGIPEDIRDRIFDEGFSSYGSTGLGLYIVKRIVERHGGSISVEENKPKGSVFVIKLRVPGKEVNLRSWMDVIEDYSRMREISKTLKRTFQILNSIGEHIVYHGPDKRIKWVNKAAADSVNAKPEELIGRFCYEIWQERQSPCGDCPVYRAWESGKYEEGVVQSPDGRVWFIRANPVIEQGEVRGIVEITSEITEKKKLEDQLKESEEIFRTLAEKSLVGVYLIQDGVFKYVNPKLAEDLGRPVEEIIGKPVLDFIYPDDMKLVAENMRKRLEGEVEWVRYNPRVVRKDGEIRILDVFGTRTMCRKKPAILGTAIDITEEEAYKKKLETYERFFRNAEDLFFILDRKGRFLEVNPKFAEILGLKPEELLGYTSSKVVHPEDLEGLKNYFNKVLQGEKGRYEFRSLTRGGEVRWFEVVEWLSDSTVEGIVRDITERKKMEEKLREREEMFSTLSEKSLFGVYLIQDGVFKYVNPKLADLWGYGVEELIGRDPVAFFHPDDKGFAKECMQRMMKGETLGFRLRILRKDGKIRINDFLASGISYKGGRAIIGSLMDITDKLELQMAKLKALEQIKKNIENYATLVDHIRNPLAVISGVLEVYEETGNKEFEKMRSLVMKSVKRIERVVENLDKGWLESEKMRKFLEGEIRKGEGFEI